MRFGIATATLVALSLLNAPAARAGCTASVYWPGDGSQKGSVTASGIPLRAGAMTAAHRTLPLRSWALVTANGRTVKVQITDRGPYVRGRCLDLTRAPARALGISGLGRVTIKPL